MFFWISWVWQSNRCACHIRRCSFLAHFLVCRSEYYNIYLGIFFHNWSHESHLPHGAGDGADDQSRSHHTFVWYNNFINEWLQLILGPQWERSDIIFRKSRLMFFFYFILILFFNSLQYPLNICWCSLYICEFKSFICIHLIENNLFNVSIGNKNWNSCFCKRIDIWIVNCSQSTGSGGIENYILSVLFFLEVILQTEISWIYIDFVSIQIYNIFFEFGIETSFFYEYGEILEPFMIFFRVFFGFVF